MLHARMLRYLDAIARTGSIRKAAAELNVASSAINRQLIALEEELGMPLFERLPRRLLLTAAGEVVIEHVRETLKAHHRALAKLDALSGLVRGRIQIALTPGLADGVVPDIVSDFLEQRPGVQIALRGMRVDLIANAVISGDVDLGLGYYLLPNSGLRPLMRFDTRFGVVMDAAHPLASAPALRLSDILGYPLVLVETGARLRAVIDNAFARMSVDAAPVVETNSIQTLKRLVTGTSRVTLLNRLDVAYECAQGTLAFRRLVEPFLDPQPLALVARARSTTGPMTNLFTEALRARLPPLAD
ncbi:LysR family transcriptional regulator [Aquabacter sp. P-9]|uniref:LysR family transcriptional regulator n=1 Tax=Aquabacter sediminis TaxID=3029197 RepID=UPI00237E2A2D|nr:LysR family transcriptional regulator [Aquabacter sp. P-9]MDE1569532.1 LysR family transcriptional regulator [Aquabacter sp. P-9]